MLLSNLLGLLVLLISLALRNGNCDITIDTATCAAGDVNFENSVLEAFDEMVAMAEAAYFRTIKTLSNELPSGNMRVVENTFRTYFGPVFGVDFFGRVNTLISTCFLNAYSTFVSKANNIKGHLIL